MPNCGETYSWRSGISYEAPPWTEKEIQKYKCYEAERRIVGIRYAKEILTFLRQNPDEDFYVSPPPEEFDYWRSDIPWLALTLPSGKGGEHGNYVSQS